MIVPSRVGIVGNSSGLNSREILVGQTRGLFSLVILVGHTFGSNSWVQFIGHLMLHKISLRNILRSLLINGKKSALLNRRH